MEHPAVYMNRSRNVTILVSVGRRFLRHIPMDGLLRVEKSLIINFSRDWIPLEKDGKPYPAARAARIYLNGVAGKHVSSEAKRLLTRIAEGAEDAPESETGDSEMIEKKTRTKRTRKAKATEEEILDTEETTPKTTKVRKGFKKKAVEEAKTSKAKRPRRIKVVEEKEEAEEVEEGTPKTSRRARYTKDQVITLLVDENPKRKGTMAWDKWEVYEDGMTVGEYLAAGGKRSTLNYDVEKGYIEIN